MIITDEQALAIAKWLGIDIKEDLNNTYLIWFSEAFIRENPIHCFKRWLLTDSGEVAMMDRAEREHIFHWDKQADHFMLVPFLHGEPLSGDAPTRRWALIYAILEVVKNER